MSEKKPPRPQPYTFNGAFVGLGHVDDASTHWSNQRMQSLNVEPQLKQVLDSHFSETAWKKKAELVVDAVSAYHCAFNANPDRKSREDMRHDRTKMLWHMARLTAYLDPHHFPQPLRIAAGAKYRPTADLAGEETLDAEIIDFLRRLFRLMRLFESTPIPHSPKTNPGKPERDQLRQRLEVIFDAPPGNGDYRGAEPGERERDRARFVSGVFEAFHIPGAPDAP